MSGADAVARARSNRWAIVSTDRLRQAEAALEEAKRRERETEQAVTLAVNRGFESLAEVIERIRIAQELVSSADQNWAEIQGRYRRRRSIIVESTIAYRFLCDSRVRLIQALYDAKIAEALERSICADF